MILLFYDNFSFWRGYFKAPFLKDISTSANTPKCGLLNTSWSIYWFLH